MSKKTPLIVVSAPSGAGKSSFCRRAVEDFPDHLVEAISCTTRSPRQGESEGDPYFFLSRDDFKEKIKQGYFIEWAEVYGHLYGTPKSQVEEAEKKGKHVITDVDIQGSKSFRKLFPNATFVFILPPSLDELRRRLEKRDQGKTSNLKMRLEAAEREMFEARHYDHQVINDNFDQSYASFKKIIEECLKNR